MSDQAFGGQRAVDHAGHAAHPDFRLVREGFYAGQPKQELGLIES